MARAFYFNTLLLTLMASPATAELVLDLRDPNPDEGTAGESFEATGTFADSGITFDVTAATTLGDMTGFFSANTTSAGINSDGVTGAGGDGASELDFGETLSISLTFPESISVLLSAIDFSGVCDATDKAIVTTPAGTVDLFSGVTDFSGADDWTPSGGIEFNSGDAIQIQASDRVSLRTVTFNTTTSVPEPSGFLYLSLATVLLGATRRFRRRS